MPALFLFISLATALPNIAETDFERAVLYLTGASEMEELDQSEIAGFQHLLEHPVHINTATKSRLLSSGLFSRYQIESLAEYRFRNGDILSMTELSMVDGFNRKAVENLSIFISLSSERDAGKRQYENCPQTIKVQAQMKKEENAGAAESVWLKYNGEFTESFEVNLANRLDFPSPSPDIGTVGAAYYGKSVLGKAVVGNFNARFGQGLALWSGTTRSGFTTASSFVKNGSGISLTQSLTSSVRGIAADFSARGFELSAGYGDCGIVFLNTTKTGRNWTTGLTAVCYGSALEIKSSGNKEITGCISADFKLGFKGGAAFGEIAYELRGAAAGVAGVFWVPAYGYKLSCCVRYYPSTFKGTWSGAARTASKTSDEQGVALGASGKWGDATFDACRHPSKDSRQYKLIANLHPEIHIRSVSVIPSARINAKYTPESQTRWRLDLRAQAEIKPGKFDFTVRYNTVHARDWSWMTYLEGAYDSAFRLFLRAGLFKVDNWDDRIYVYERDAPGNYNCPSLYGRGWWSSLLAGLKIKKEKRTSHYLYLRSSYTAYPFMAVPKPSKLELKLQYSISF